MAKDLPTQQELRRLFDYNPYTGTLTWQARDDRSAYWNRRYAGTKAGSRYGRYINVRIYTEAWRAHRIIWKWAYGSIPNDMQIDHIDGDGHNNRLDNLRLATAAQNQWNMRTPKGRSHKGVYKRKHGFVAEITVNQCRVYLGFFKNETEAVVAYQDAARVHFGEFANTKGL